jgi:hypothetical protein
MVSQGLVKLDDPIEKYLPPYGSLVGLKERCSYYAHGTQLTPEGGGQALICLLGGGLLTVINLPVNATTTVAKELASRSIQYVIVATLNIHD